MPSDPPDSALLAGERCPRCDAWRQTVDGLCLGCLLQTGLNEDAGEACAAEELDFSDLPEGHWRFGGYELLEEIGRGGMGVIYRARQPHSRRLVALKKILPHLSADAETNARLRREAETAASLDHPHILPIYEVGQSGDGQPFFSMKLAAGTLAGNRAALLENPRLAVELMLKVALAVQYAHEHGIIHRDLKPGNILLDAHGEPLVADFGLARWLENPTDLTQTLTTFGTPGYMAPEQGHLSAKLAGEMTDLYSLGAILFDLLAGRPPFVGSNALAVLREAGDHAAPPLRRLVPGLDRDLETICARCLERDPKARYRSARHLAADLRCWLERRPIHARPVSLGERGWSWARRNRVLAAVAAISLLAVALGLGQQWRTWQWEKTQREEALNLRSVALLPIECIDGCAGGGAIARQWTDFLQKTLASSPQVRFEALKGHQQGFSQERFKRTADALGVSTLLAGTLRQLDGQVRLKVSLFHAESGTALYFEELENAAPPSAAAQKKLRAAVLDWFGPGFNLQARPPDPRVATKSAEARGFLDNGREYFQRRNPQDLDRALASFAEALRLDPAYALAHALMASACSARYGFDLDPIWMERSLSHATEAIRLNPGLAEGHRSLATILMRSGQCPEALQAGLTAYELNPLLDNVSGTLGDIYEELGQPRRALLWHQRAQLVEPRPGSQAVYIGRMLALLNEDAAAEKMLRKGMSYLSDQIDCRIELTRLRLMQHRIAEAREVNEETIRLFPGDPGPWRMALQIEFFAGNFARIPELAARLKQEMPRTVPADTSVSLDGVAGYVQLQQDRAAGEALLRPLIAAKQASLAGNPRKGRAFFDLAALESSIGDTGPAIAHFRQAIDLGWIKDYRLLEIDPRFTNMLSQPEGAQVLADLRERVTRSDL